MPPVLALSFGIILIGYLFWVDRNNCDGVSSAIWIPLIWMFLSSSRYVSQWIGFGSMGLSAESVIDGSPLDRYFFAILIVAGVVVLRRRRLSLIDFFSRNWLVWLYFAFGAVSFIWSDYPYVSFKRWFKAIGNIIMLLVILSEERPYNALVVIIRRLSFVFLPLSVVFIKYFPELGRAYHMGKPMFTGIAMHKNGLGQICLISGIYFTWDILFKRRQDNDSADRLHGSIYILLIPMIAWLFYYADSATSLVCMAVAMCLFAAGAHNVIASHPQRILKLGLVAVALFAILEIGFDIKDLVIAMLGRSPDLTTRIPMWEDLLSMVKNPVFGFGFESFWLGPRREYMEQVWGIGIQAHNGYIEMYLNMGLIGLFFIVAWITKAVTKIHELLETDYPSAVLNLCWVLVVVMYSWTEASFYGTNNMWILLLFAVISMPSAEPVEQTAGT